MVSVFLQPIVWSQNGLYSNVEHFCFNPQTIIFLLYLVLSNVEPCSILERILLYGLPLSTDKLCTFNKWLKSLTVFGTHKRIILRCYFNSFLRKGWSISDYIATCMYILSQCWMLFPSNFWQCIYQTSQTMIIIITGVFDTCVQWFTDECKCNNKLGYLYNTYKTHRKVWEKFEKNKRKPSKSWNKS